MVYKLPFRMHACVKREQQLKQQVHGEKTRQMFKKRASQLQNRFFVCSFWWFVSWMSRSLSHLTVRVAPDSSTFSLHKTLMSHIITVEDGNLQRFDTNDGAQGPRKWEGGD